MVRATTPTQDRQLRMALCFHKMKKSTEGLKVLARLLAEDNLPRLVAAHWLLSQIPWVLYVAIGAMVPALWAIFDGISKIDIRLEGWRVTGRPQRRA